MLILSQNKTAIINLDLCVAINMKIYFYYKDKEIFIIRACNFDGIHDIPLGQYAGADTAKNVINTIFNSRVSFFTMPEKNFSIDDAEMTRNARYTRG